MPGQPLRVSVYPAESSTATLYEDEGATLEYRTGAFSKRRFTQTRARDQSTGRDRAAIEGAASEGRYRWAARSLVLSVRWTDEPASDSVARAGGAAAVLE
jgi:hypothetical protein